MRQIALFIVLAFSTAGFPEQGRAQQTIDPEWPCIQVLVPEIVTAVMWPEEISADQRDLWKSKAALRGIVEALGDVDEFTDTERLRIEEFAESIPEASRLETLNSVADGIVTVANKKRDLYIKGIKKYTRQQISIAGQIESTLNDLAKFDRSSQTSSEASTEATTDENQSAESRAEIEETLAWHQRVYDQREHAISSLCDVPVELEQRLSSVMRELAQYLP